MKSYFIFADGGYQFIFHFIGTHLGFQVISSYFGRRNQNTILSLERSFATAVKEESNMGVFLGLGDAQLGHAHLAQILAKAVFHADAREGDEHVRHGRVILGVADVGERGRTRA